jgi:hypothetical protein
MFGGAPGRETVGDRVEPLYAGGRGATWFAPRLVEAVAGADDLPYAFGGFGTLWLSRVMAVVGVRVPTDTEGECGATGAVLAAGGMVLAEAFRVAGSTLPPAALAGMALRREKSAGLAVAAIAGLPPLYFANNCLFWLAAVSCCACCRVG